MLLHRLLPARDKNIQSFIKEIRFHKGIWLHKGNQNEFLKHPKILNFLDLLNDTKNHTHNVPYCGKLYIQKLFKKLI